jgi:hypothetical protein
MLDNLHRAALDDEEFVFTIARLEKMLAIAQKTSCAELGQRGDLRVVERGERNLVQVQIGHGVSPLAAHEFPLLPQGLCDPSWHVELHLIDVTPGPPLAALKRGHYRMSRAFEMFGGMAIGRAVATADVAAGQAETQMHPRRSTLQAFLTSRRAGRHGLNSRHV